MLVAARGMEFRTATHNFDSTCWMDLPSRRLGKALRICFSQQCLADVTFVSAGTEARRRAETLHPLLQQNSNGDVLICAVHSTDQSHIA